MALWVLFLSVLFIALATSAFFAQRIPLVFKFLVIGIAVVMASVIVTTTEPYMGWPTDATIASGRVVAVQVINPTPNENGHIYLWAYATPTTPTWLDGFFYQFPDRAPRVYTVPYSSDNSKKFNEAAADLKKGDSITFTNHKGKGGLPGINRNQQAYDLTIKEPQDLLNKQ